MRRNCETSGGWLLWLIVLVAAGAPLLAQSAQPPVPESYRRFFVHFADKRTLTEKALNTVGLTNQVLGRSFALVAGVSRYPNFPLTERELNPAAEDMRRLVVYLRDQEFFDEIVVLRDEQMTYDNLEFFLQGYFPQRLQQFPRSRFLLAYSGHGMGDERSGYLVTGRAASLTDRYNRLGLSVLRELLEEVVVRGHHVLVLLNACHGGVFLRRPFGAQTALPQQPGAHAITAGGTRELAWYQPNIGPGSVFFEKLFAGLDGRSDVLPERPDGGRGDGVITVDELSAYLRHEVRVSTDERQNPRVGDVSPSGSKGGFFFLNRQRLVKAGLAPEWRAVPGRSFGAEPGSPIWEALERYRSEEYDAARSMFLRAAEEGITDAMLYLAEMYDSGRGVKEDLGAATRWYRMAAEAGDPRAMEEMGRRFATGRGVTRDRKEAFRWCLQAAEKKSAPGMNAVGLAYRRGVGVDRNDSEAVRWFREAAGAGQAEAMAELGAMYAEGAGVAKDDATAVDWLQKAVAAGALNGMRYLATMHELGRGVPKDDRTALRLLRKAADAGDAPAMVLLGRKYVQLDQLEAKRLFQQAANAGAAEGMRELANLYDRGIGVNRDESAARKLLEQAAANDDIESMRRLGMHWDQPHSSIAWLREAIGWYRKAAAFGDEFSIARLRTLAGAKPVFELVHTFEEPRIRKIAFSSDGRLALLVPHESRMLSVWDATEWKELRRIEIRKFIYLATFNPAGTQLGLCLQGPVNPVTNNAVGVFDLAKDDLIQDVGIPDSSCRSLWFQGENLLVASALGGGYETKYFLLEVSVPLGKLSTLFSGPNLVGATPEGMLIAVRADGGSRIEIRERSTGKVRTTLAARKRLREVLSFSGDGAFSDDGRLFAAEDTEGVRIWDLTSGQAPLMIPERGDRLVFSPDGALLAIVDSSWLRLWDTKTGELRQTMEDDPSAFAFRPDGELLVTAEWDGPIRVWQAK